MTDRKLLESAARAAGIKGTFAAFKELDTDKWGIVTYLGFGYAKFWNPLTDNDNAFTLSVTLGMETHCDDEAAHTAFAYARVRGTGEDHLFEPVVDDPFKAMRRVITRAAAAAIGKESK